MDTTFFYKVDEDVMKGSRNRMICFKDKTMYDWNFDNDDGTVPLMKLARKYVDSFQEMIHKSAGLLLWGDVGTGKSYMAA